MKNAAAHERELAIEKMLKGGDRQATKSIATSITAMGDAMKKASTKITDFAKELEGHKERMESEELKRLNDAFLEAKFIAEIKSSLARISDENSDFERYVDVYGNIRTKATNTKNKKPNDEEPVKTAKPQTPLDDIDLW